MEGATAATADVASKEPPQTFERGFRFWAIIAGLGVTTILAALEHTVVTTSAPVILRDLRVRENFVWITNAFFICSAAFQPLLGQLSNIFGRRWIYLSIVAIFTLGSGICGGATNASMLIAGRAVQGLGSGGIIMMTNIIVSDLVPLRQRGNYIAMILAIFGIGVALGPLIGGAIVNSTTWRWVFYLNLPIGGASLIIMFLFLHVNYNREMSFKQKIKRIDLIGNGILMAGTVAVLYSLTYAGTLFSWSSWHTLVPWLLGFLGIFLFVGYEAIALFSTPRTGYSLLLQAIAGIPGAAVAAVLLNKYGKFKPLHLAGFATTTLGMGILSLQHEGTAIAAWAAFQCVTALGIGMIIDTLLPAFQAPITETDQAAATAAWSFVRAFGTIWGVAIPAAIFNNRVDDLLGTVSDLGARQLLANGGAYQQASASFVKQYDIPVQTEIRTVYREALKRVFLIGIAFGGLATLLVLLEREVPLRQELETEYGLKPGDQKQSDKDIELKKKTAETKVAGGGSMQAVTASN